MANSNSYLISFNQQTSFDSMHATYLGRSIAALWKTTTIRMQFSYELYLMGSCLPDEGGICRDLLQATSLIGKQKINRNY